MSNDLDQIIPVAQPESTTTQPDNPVALPSNFAQSLATVDTGESPRATSVATPLPDAAPAPGSQSYVPPVVADAMHPEKDMAYLRSLPSDQGFDTAVALDKGDLRWALQYFKGINPEQAAQVEKLRREFGTTTSIAEAGKDTMQSMSEAQRIYNSLSATDDQGNFIYPNTARFLTANNYANLPVAKDDVDALAGIEQVVRQRAQAGEGTFTQMARSMFTGTVVDGAEDVAHLPGAVWSAAKHLAGSVASDQGPIGQTFNEITGNIFQRGDDSLAPAWLRSLHQGLTSDSNPEWLNTFFGGTTDLERYKRYASGITFDNGTLANDWSSGDYSKMLERGAVQASGFLPMLLAGATLGPGAAAVTGTGQAVGSQYGQDLQNGKTSDQAGENALLTGLVNYAGLRSYGLPAQLERFAQPVARESATAMWGRLAKQFVTGGVQAGATQGAIQGSTAFSDYLTGNPHALDNIASDITTAAVLGFVTDGAMSMPLGLLRGWAQMRDQQGGAQFWQQLTGAVDQSKLKRRDPDALAGLITQNLESAGRPTTVNVDADKVTTYFQNNGGDLNKFASDMGTTAEDINNAAAASSPIELPVGPYQAKYAGTSLDQALAQHIRFSPGGLSAQELEEQIAHVSQLQESIKQELDRTASEGQPLPNEIRAMRAQLMADKAEGGKGMSANEADSLVSVLMAGIKHSVAMPGESVADAVRRIGLSLRTNTKPEDVGAKPDAKGAIQFGPGSTAIHLFENSNRSTFLHEMAHLFLQQRQDLIDRGVASPQAAADHAALHEFAGVEAGAKPNTEHIEKLARAFESYLREGKAPSLELAGPFSRFRNWLTSVYRSLRGLGKEPTDEVRQVFDRMLASEDDIAHAQEYYNRKGDLLNLIKADEKDKADARDKLAKVQRTELEKQTRAYLKSYLQAIGGMKEIRAQAEEAVEKSPVYQALETAKGGKIDEESLRDAIGSKGLAEFKAKFPGLVKEGGENTLETLAAKHGFESPQTLADNLLAAVPKVEAIKNYASRLVAEKEQQLRDEIVNRGATPADGTMHSEGSLAYLIAETNLLAKQLGGRPQPINAKVYRDAAHAMISEMPVRRAVRYSDFARAEARLAKQVLDLAKRSQLQDKINADGTRTDGALTARKKQIMQHALVQEAIKAREAVDAIARRYAPSKFQPRLDKVENQYLDPIKEILSRYGLSDERPAKPFDLRTINDLDGVLFSQIPTWIVNGENTLRQSQDYRDLTFGQLQDVDDSARSVIEFGTDTLKSMLGEDEKTVAALTEKALATIQQLRARERRQIGGRGFSNSTADAWAQAVRAIDIAGSHLTKFQFMARWLDFFGRSVHTRIFDAIRDGEKAQGDAQDAFYKLAQPHLETLANATNRLRKERGNRFAIDGVAKPAAYAEDGEMNWSPEELVAYMMNTGSEGNIAALKNAFGHGAAEFDRVAQLFSGDELRSMDGLRKALDTLFPALDETNFKLYNRHVEKVAAVSQDLTDSEGKPVHLDGGYWPLMFNRRVNDRRGLGGNKDADVLEDQTRAMVRAARPQDGFTKSRVVGHALAPRLDMGVLTDHVDNVTRFAHVAPIIRDANRMMTNPAWRDAVVSKVGEAEYKQMIEWLRYQANPGRKSTDDLNRGIDHWLGKARILGTKSAMGLNLLSFFKWRTALFNGAVALGGWKWVARGYGDAGLRGLSTSTIGLTSNELWREMVAKSNVLGPRESHGVRELQQDVENMKWSETKFQLPFTGRTITSHDLKGALYSFATYGDRAVVFPVWRGAYIKYMETMADPSHTDEQRDKAAVAYADDIVQSSQPTSMNVDLSSLHRDGREVVKLLSMFTAYPVTLLNRGRGHYEAYRNNQLSLPGFVNNMLQEGVMEPMARTFITAGWHGTLPTAAALAFAPITNAIGVMPVVSSVVNAVWNGDANELSPALDSIKLVGNFLHDVKTEKGAMQIGWDVARLAGYATGVPLANAAKPILEWIANAYGEKNTFK